MQEDPRREAIFATQRIKLLRSEVQSLGVEVNAARMALREMKDKKSADAKMLKQRIIYAEIRGPQAKEELKQFVDKRREVVAARNAATNPRKNDVAE